MPAHSGYKEVIFSFLASSGEYGQGQSSLDGATGVPQSSLDGAAMASQSSLDGAAMAPQCALGGAAMAPQCALGGAAMEPQCALGGAAMASQCALGGAAMAPQCALGGAAMAPQCALGGAAMAPQCALGGAAMAPQCALGGVAMAPQCVLGGAAMESQCALGGAAMAPQCALGGAAMAPQCALGGVAMAPQCHLDGATGTPQRALVGAIRAPQSSLGGGASEAPRPLGAADAPQGALRGVGNSPDVVRAGPVGTAGSSPSVGLLERPAGVLVEKIWERITGASDDANDASRLGAQSSGGTVGASVQGTVGIGMIGDLVGTFDPAGMLGSGVESFDISTPRGTAGALGVEQPPGLVVEGRVMEEPQIVPFWSPVRKAYERMGYEWEKNQRMSEGGHGSVSYQTGSVPALSAGLGVGQGLGVQPQNQSPPRDVLMDPVELFRIRCMRDAEERFRRGLQQIACPEQNSAGTSGGSFATAVEETEGFVPPPPPKPPPASPPRAGNGGMGSGMEVTGGLGHGSMGLLMPCGGNMFGAVPPPPPPLPPVPPMPREGGNAGGFGFGIGENPNETLRTFELPKLDSNATPLTFGDWWSLLNSQMGDLS